MTVDISADFATQWADAWNQRDIEAVLKYFHDDIVFTSPTALVVVGTSSVHGKRALRAYWQAALARRQSLHFTVERCLWDPVRRELAIIYTAIIDGHARKVSENLGFNEDGMVISAEVFHGVPMPG